MLHKFVMSIVLIFPLAAATADDYEKPMDPTGLWARDNKHYVFDVRYCSNAKRELCADLVEVHPEKQKRAQKFVGQTLVTGLKQRGINDWRGTFFFRKYRVSGWIKMVDANTAKVGGCILLFLCDEYTLRRQKS